MNRLIQKILVCGIVFFGIRTADAATSSAPAAPTAQKTVASPVAKLLANNLVVPAHDNFAYYKLPNPGPDYFALYFSAGWCGPCHKFTPKLVKFYQQMKAHHDNFEVIFVSFDKNEDDMLTYMHELSMPWPAVRFSEGWINAKLKACCGPGIPCLVVIDAKGNVIANSYEKGKYVGPSKPMEYLGKLLESSP